MLVEWTIAFESADVANYRVSLVFLGFRYAINLIYGHGCFDYPEKNSGFQAHVAMAQVVRYVQIIVEGPSTFHSFAFVAFVLLAALRHRWRANFRSG